MPGGVNAGDTTRINGQDRERLSPCVCSTQCESQKSCPGRQPFSEAVSTRPSDVATATIASRLEDEEGAGEALQRRRVVGTAGVRGRLTSLA